jgi:hypothetical protein
MIDVRFIVYAHVAPGRSALLVGRRLVDDPTLPWLTPEDVDHVLKVVGRGRVYLRLRDNQAGEAYVDEGWSDEIH